MSALGYPQLSGSEAGERTIGGRGSTDIANSSIPAASERLASSAPTAKEQHQSLSSDRLKDISSSAAPVAESFRYVHLPTPQSPLHLGQYRSVVPQTPESPVPRSSTQGQYLTLFPGKPRVGEAIQGRPTQNVPLSPQRVHHQIMTPESSPLVPRLINPPPDAVPTRLNTPTSSPPNPSSPSRVEFPMQVDHTLRTPPPLPSSGLSSPFTAKPPSSERSSKARASRQPSPVVQAIVEDVFAEPTGSGSRIPVARTGSEGSIRPSGGELERIRLAVRQGQITQMQDLESRRPDYLKRTKRGIRDVDMEDDVSIGITESPNKGRRLTLFQETSEESFEESLMAGGYGRYRTADWVRQPQPVVISPGTAGPSNIVSMLEEAEESPPPAPPSEKELKKQKRLAAFRTDAANPSSRLYPVELEGRGRVLLDIPNDPMVESSEAASKKRGTPAATSRRKKKVDQPGRDRRTMAPALAEMASKPNWPDTEFPWRLRTEERAEAAKAEENERMQWIERFLDRDTDEEDDGDQSSPVGNDGDEDEEVVPSSRWGLVYDDEMERPLPPRRGRGKMVPLHADPAAKTGVRRVERRSTYFPSDPADARAALLAKKCVRTLTSRQQQKARHAQINEEDSEGETTIVCVCRRHDDGRELVQCDRCKMWFHLDCLGLRKEDLGGAEDSWFCTDCAPDDEGKGAGVDARDFHREPTFAPTDDTPRAQRLFDGTLYLPDSPRSPGWVASSSRVPKTPTRNPRSTREVGFDPSSSSTLSRYTHEPVTPRQLLYHRGGPGGVRVHLNTPGAPEYHMFDELPFDPTSTPSRGIKFTGNTAAGFATPKYNVFGGRSNAAQHQTPSKPRNAGSRSFGGVGFLSSALDDARPNEGYNLYPRPGLEDSPVRRVVQASRVAEDALRPRRVLGDVTTAPTQLPITMHPVSPKLSHRFDEPKGKDRMYDYQPATAPPPVGVGDPESSSK